MTDAALTRTLTASDRVRLGSFLAATVGNLVAGCALLVLAALTVLGVAVNLGLMIALAVLAVTAKLYLVVAQHLVLRRSASVG